METADLRSCKRDWLNMIWGNASIAFYQQQRLRYIGDRKIPLGWRTETEGE